MGSKHEGYRPYVLRVPEGTHWFLKNQDGHILDPTLEQFDEGPPDYEKAKCCGFLTRDPSRRARIVIERVQGMS